jgi:hypothetical protein
MPAERQTRVLRAMARYQMTVVFDVHEEVEMKYVYRMRIDNDEADLGSLAYIALNEIENYSEDKHWPKQPHINKLYDDVLERMETSSKHPMTYDIVSFDKLK